MALLTLIKPFRWASPVVCSLPGGLLDLLSSPVPLIVGMPCSKEFITSNKIPNRFDHCVFVILDDCTFFTPPEVQKSMVVPFFNGFLENIRPMYAYFNGSKSRNQMVIDQSPSGRVSLKGGLAQSPSKNLLYSIKQTDIEIVMQLMEMFKENLLMNIVNCLPKEPAFSNPNHLVK
jgi:hypothetical protein